MPFKELSIVWAPGGRTMVPQKSCARAKQICIYRIEKRQIFASTCLPTFNRLEKDKNSKQRREKRVSSSRLRHPQLDAHRVFGLRHRDVKVRVRKN